MIDLPDRAAFAPFDGAYLDSGAKHPLPLGAELAAHAYLRNASLGRHPPQRDLTGRIREAFARIIGAKPAEIALTTATTEAEQMILRGLGLPETGGRVVTDALHFPGSRPIYDELGSRGVEIEWVRAVHGRASWDDMREAIRPGTTLVVVSAVSSINGFQHDMRRLCRHAHAHGALVYADIVQAAGCTEIDVKDWGVDFAACSSYKYLMGDFGLGFVYAREEALQRFRRPQYGRYGLIESAEEPHSTPRKDEWIPGAEGHFAQSTLSRCVAAQLAYSLHYIERLSVARIYRHLASLGNALRRELTRLRFDVLTPEESTGSIVTFSSRAGTSMAPALVEHGIRVTQRPGQIRVTTAVFNDEKDIEMLMAALTSRPRASSVHQTTARRASKPVELGASRVDDKRYEDLEDATMTTLAALDVGRYRAHSSPQFRYIGERTAVLRRQVGQRSHRAAGLEDIAVIVALRRLIEHSGEILEGALSGNGCVSATPGLWNRMMYEWPMGEYGRVLAEYINARGLAQGKILELGAGVGDASKFVQPDAPIVYVKTDCDPVILRMYNHGGVLEAFDIDYDDVRYRNFDLVFTSNVLHCVADKAKVLRNILRMLAPRGHLVFSEGTPEVRPAHEWCLAPLFGFFEGWWDRGGFIDVHHWSEHLVAAGFTIVERNPMRGGRNVTGHLMACRKGP